VVQVLARQTTKRKNTIQDRAARWDMEEVLQKRKMFPTFHWPKEFLEPMKKLKEDLKKG
jgi:hypothetical protein